MTKDSRSRLRTLCLAAHPPSFGGDFFAWYCRAIVIKSRSLAISAEAVTEIRFLIDYSIVKISGSFLYDLDANETHNHKK